MNKNIEQALSGFSYDEQRRMRDVITALDNGKVYSVNFYGDGSGAAFEYYHPTADHGLPCTMRSSFNIKQVQIILAGHRLCSHKHPKCYY
jgi:hypothetical protein